MGGLIESILFRNLDLNEIEQTDWLTDNIGDEIEVSINVRHEDQLIVTTETPTDGTGISIVLNPDTILSQAQEDDRLVWTNRVDGFVNLRVGDMYTVQINTLEFRTTKILEKKSDQLLLMDIPYGLIGQHILNVGRLGFYSTPIEALVFRDNLIPNDNPVSFKDITTGVDRKAVIQGVSNTNLSPQLMDQLGDNCYKFGDINALGNEIGNGPTVVEVSQAFTITRTLLIAPLITANEIDNFRSGIDPPYLEGDNSLKYIVNVEMSEKLSDPNDIKIIAEDDRRGNIGNFGQNMKTGISGYSVSDLVYERLDSTPLPAIELSTNKMKVKFRLNSVNGTFTNGITRIVIKHFFLPTPEDLYRLPEFADADPDNPNEARERTFIENFFFDKIVCTLGTPATVSRENGNPTQIIDSCNTTYVTDFTVDVELFIEIAVESVERIASTTARGYSLFVSTCDHTKSRSESDKVNEPIDKNFYHTDNTDPSMVTMVNSFRNHPMNALSTPKQSLVIFPNDDFVSSTIFGLKRFDEGDFIRVGTEVLMVSVTAELIAKKDESTFFVLDKYDTDLNDPQIIQTPDGGIQEIDETDNRGFASPVDDLRRFTTVKRRSDLDGGEVYYYELSFTSVFRDDAHRPLKTANNEFYDRDAPENHHKGKNHDWYHYFDGTDWNFYYRFTLFLLKDGVPISYTLESQLLTDNYTDGIEWNNENLLTFKTDLTGDPIPNNGFAQGQNTRIQGEKTYIGLDAAPPLPNLHTVIWVRQFEKGDFKSLFIISSLYDIQTNNALIGLTANLLRATKTAEAANVFQVQAELNHLNFASDSRIEFGIRFYDDREESVLPPSKLLEDGTVKLMEIGISKELE